MYRILLMLMNCYCCRLPGGGPVKVHSCNETEPDNVIAVKIVAIGVSSLLCNITVELVSVSAREVFAYSY